MNYRYFIKWRSSPPTPEELEGKICTWSWQGYSMDSMLGCDTDEHGFPKVSPDYLIRENWYSGRYEAFALYGDGGIDAESTAAIKPNVGYCACVLREACREHVQTTSTRLREPTALSVEQVDYKDEAAPDELTRPDALEPAEGTVIVYDTHSAGGARIELTPEVRAAVELMNIIKGSSHTAPLELLVTDEKLFEGRGGRILVCSDDNYLGCWQVYTTDGGIKQDCIIATDNLAEALIALKGDSCL